MQVLCSFGCRLKTGLSIDPLELKARASATCFTISRHCEQVIAYKTAALAAKAELYVLAHSIDETLAKRKLKVYCLGSCLPKMSRPSRSV